VSANGYGYAPPEDIDSRSDVDVVNTNLDGSCRRRKGQGKSLIRCGLRICGMDIRPICTRGSGIPHAIDIHVDSQGLGSMPRSVS